MEDEKKLVFKKDRARNVMRQKDIKNKDIAEAIGITQKHVSNVLNGKAGVSYGTAKQIEELLGVPLDFLTGETDDPAPFKNEKAHPDLSKIGVDVDKKMMLVPVVSGAKACCGNGNMYPDSIEWEVDSTIPMPIAKKDLDGYSWQSRDFKIIQVEGDSMSPRINDGDHVLFVHGVDVSDGQFAVVLHDDRLFVRAIDRRNGDLMLRPVNEGYMAREVREGDDFYIVGLVLYIVPKPKPAGRLW